MALAQKLESLEKQHQHLEFAIENLTKHPFPDEVELKQLKVRKLALKDWMSELSHKEATAA